MNDRDKLVRMVTGGILKMLLIKWGIILTLNFVARKLR